MPTYVIKQADSDLGAGVQFSKVISEGTESAGSINVSVPGLSQDNGFVILPHGLPNSSTWESGGSVSLELNITATNGGTAATWRARCRVQRRNMAGTVIQNGVFTAFQGLDTTGVKTFSMTAPTWTAAEEDCANRFSIVIQFENNTGAIRTCTIESGTTNAEVVSSITENSSTCRRIFIP